MELDLDRTKASFGSSLSSIHYLNGLKALSVLVQVVASTTIMNYSNGGLTTSRWLVGFSRDFFVIQPTTNVNVLPRSR